MISEIKRTFHFINHHPLAKRHLILAYSKFFWWQIRSKFTKDFVKIPFINDTYFWAKKGLTGITGNIYSGLHEFEDMSFALHFLNEEDTFFDVGANVGAYTLLASGGKKSKVLAFEPILSTFEILEKNIKLNSINQLTKAINYGVGAVEKTVPFTKDIDTQNHVSRSNLDETIPITIVPLDKYYPKNIPALLKIDVEGFEWEVLKGAANIIADKGLKAIIIELNGAGANYGVKDEDIHELLVCNSFMPYTYNPFKRAFTAQKSFGSFNTIYIRDLNFVENRIKSSPKFRIFGEYI